MKRDILNHLGEKIGDLEMPDDTSEETWIRELSKYSKPPEKPTIQDVTPRQFRQALIFSGISEQTILNAINSLTEPTKSLAKIEWEYSNSFQRNNALVNQMAPLIGFSQADLDNLWILASTL